MGREAGFREDISSLEFFEGSREKVLRSKESLDLVCWAEEMAFGGSRGEESGCAQAASLSDRAACDAPAVGLPGRGWRWGTQGRT